MKQNFDTSAVSAGEKSSPLEAAHELWSKSEGSSAQQTLGYCPRCSTRLEGRSCKLICPVCNYYMSCSDFY